ncbi:9409_t:CDS:2 [Dentiscutata erythropus]|uniref:9409_t:CDS:1 n=1 Tax=Dentiscutata erythropus TaxID=1348616 RepID=A0A9N9FBC4_9GLOM|nr:9409_t:CDS:2 [Dentiscutata erythropus]
MCVKDNNDLIEIVDPILGDNNGQEVILDITQSKFVPSLDLLGYQKLSSK